MASSSYLESIDSQLSQWVNPTDANNNAIAATATTVANPDGNAIKPSLVTPATNVVQWVNWQSVNDSTVGDVTPLPISQKPLTPTTDVSNSDIATSNVIAADSNIVNTADSEKTSQIDLTQELSAVDKNQAETKIANAQANIAELTLNEKKQQLLKEENELKYQEDLRLNQGEEIAALKVQQASELVKNDAEAADMKAKQDKAERDAETANEVAQMQSNVAFAKLGWSFSGAAINTAQKLFTDGAYNIASLKSSNAYDYASLKVKINSVAFDHIQVISKIIQDTSEKEFASKERLREFIWNSQNNILLGKKEAQKAVQDAITTYKTEQQSREDKLYSDMNSANTRLQTATEDIQKQVTAKQTTTKSTIDLMVANGQWSKLTPIQQNEYETNAWLPLNSTSKSVITKATQNIYDSVKELAGKDVIIPNATLALMQIEVKRAMDMGIWLIQASKMALDKYKNKIPELTNALALQKTKAMNEAEKAYAEIEKTKSETEENLAQANKATADAAKAWRSWTWGWASTWSTQAKAIEYTVEEPLTWFALIAAQKLWLPTTKTITKKAMADYNPKAAGWSKWEVEWVPIHNVTKVETPSLMEQLYWDNPPIK